MCQRDHLRWFRVLGAASFLFQASAVHMPTAVDFAQEAPDDMLESNDTFEESLLQNAQTVQNCGLLRHGGQDAWMGPSVWTQPQSLALKAWQDLPSSFTETMASSKPKLGIAMMIYHRIVFSESWETVLTEPNTSFAMSIHAKGEAHLPLFFQKFLLSEKMSNGWCENREMMLWLMSKVLATDRDVTHVAIVSGDTLPIKPLSHITADLRKNPHSHFCADVKWKRAETFFVMKRGHVDFLQENREHLRHLLETLDAHKWSDCVDEDTFYWPLSVRKEPMANSCPMMTDWSGTDKYWSVNAERCNCPEFLKSMKSTPDCGHPAMFHSITRDGLDQLFSSPAGYWFVRKFPGDGAIGSATYGEGGDAALDPAVVMVLMNMRSFPVTTLLVN